MRYLNFLTARIESLQHDQMTYIVNVPEEIEHWQNVACAGAFAVGLEQAESERLRERLTEVSAILDHALDREPN